MGFFKGNNNSKEPKNTDIAKDNASVNSVDKIDIDNLSAPLQKYYDQVINFAREVQEVKDLDIDKDKKEIPMLLNKLVEVIQSTSNEAMLAREEAATAKKEAATAKKEVENIKKDTKENQDVMRASFSAKNVEEVLCIIGAYGEKVLNVQECDVYGIDAYEKGNLYSGRNNNGTYERGEVNLKDYKEIYTAVANKQASLENHVISPDTHNRLTVPLYDNYGEVLGVVVAKNKQDEKGNIIPFTQDDIDMFDKQSQEGKFTFFSNILEQRRAEQISHTDKLTKLDSRTEAEEYIKRTIYPLVEQGEDVSVLFFDIDKFKNFNDTYGHNVGDECLYQVASTLKDNCRHGDRVKVCRYGGEEMIAFVFAKEEEATVIAERVRKAVEDKPLIVRNENGEVKASLSVNISGGVKGLDKQDLHSFEASIEAIKAEITKKIDSVTNGKISDLRQEYSEVVKTQMIDGEPLTPEKINDYLQKTQAELQMIVAQSKVEIAQATEHKSLFNHYFESNIYKQADNALYISKECGRNKITSVASIEMSAQTKAYLESCGLELIANADNARGNLQNVTYDLKCGDEVIETNLTKDDLYALIEDDLKTSLIPSVEDEFNLHHIGDIENWVDKAPVILNDFINEHPDDYEKLNALRYHLTNITNMYSHLEGDMSKVEMIQVAANVKSDRIGDKLLTQRQAENANKSATEHSQPADSVVREERTRSTDMPMELDMAMFDNMVAAAKSNPDFYSIPVAPVVSVPAEQKEIKKTTPKVDRG